MIGAKRIEHASARWRKEYEAGTLVLESDTLKKNA